jgi:hypothetical protein
MSGALAPPRILAALIGGVEALLGAAILLTSLGTPSNNPAGVPGALDYVVGAALIAAPLAAVVTAMLTRSAIVAWACVGIVAAIFFFALTNLFL